MLNAQLNIVPVSDTADDRGYSYLPPPEVCIRLGTSGARLGFVFANPDRTVVFELDDIKKAIAIAEVEYNAQDTD